MRAFIAAISFACMLAVASNMAVTNYNLAPVVQAQGDGNWLIVSKSVQGAIPESDWQFVYLWSGTAVSSNFIIDKAGGVTSFHISWGAYAKVIEMTKSGYTVSIIYGTTRGANTLVGNVVTLYGIPEFAPARTYYVDFYNSYTPQKTPGYTGPRYVGGEMTTVNKLGVLAPYLGLIVFLETLAVVMTKRKKKANC